MTGAMANRDTAVQALMDKAGIIRVSSRADMIDTACAAIACRGTAPPRRKNLRPHRRRGTGGHDE
nr:hypothetical protein [Desulfobacula sp.]